MGRMDRPRISGSSAGKCDAESAVEASTAPAVLIKSRRIIQISVLNVKELLSADPIAKGISQPGQRNRHRFLLKSKLRRRHQVSLGKALRDAHAHSRTLVLLVAAGGEPDVQRQHLRVDGTALKIVDGRKRIHLVRIVKHSHTSKWLGFAAHAKLRDDEGGPGAAKCLRCRPLNERVAKDDGAIA